MTIGQAKAVFIWGTAVSTLIFLVLTFDAHRKFVSRTHEDTLNDSVVAGKWVWQKYNCNDCHTILGIGGYYAPDVTKVMGYRDRDWLTAFLKDPARVWPAERKMPNLHLNDREISDVITFLGWVNGIDTNAWPPKPMVASSARPAPARGESIFRSQGCVACHMISGVGGKIGPDLSDVGGRRDRRWIEEQIINPRSHNPNSIMPGFGKMPGKDRADLVDYLSGLRRGE